MKKICCVFLVLSALFSQWSDAPENPVTVGTGIQPRLAALPDGSSYLAWLSASSFHVYLQMLDPTGVPLFGTGGLLISDHPNNSWIAVYHLNLIADAEGNAILSFVDTRTDTWNVFIYKISPDGEFLWGDDGIQLSQGAADNISPRLTLLSDDAIVVSWCADYSVIHAQKLTPEGVTAWGDAGLIIEDPDAALENPLPLPAENGAVILRWIRQTGPYWASTSEILQQKYDANGDAVWAAPTAVSGPVTLPMGNWSQQLIGYAVGGSYSAWTILTGTNQSAFAQSVSQEGNTNWGSGVELSTLDDHFRTNPVITNAADTHELTAVWSQANGSQSQHGIYAQRLSVAGGRLWGNSGIPVVPLNSQYSYLDISIAAFDEDAVLVYLQQSGASQGNLFATRMDATGNFMWTPEILQLTTSGSSKSDAAIQKGPSCVFIAWSESGEIRAHCLHGDGTLGAPVIEDDCLPNGDVNSDGELNVLDIVTIVNFILGQQLPTEDQQCAADLNSDAELNILDIVLILNLIVGV